MKNLIWVILALLITSSCRDNSNDSEPAPPVESTVIPASYLGKWKATHIQINDGSGWPYFVNTKDYYVQFNSNNTAEVKSPNGTFSGTSVYKKNGTNDSFMITDINKDRLIINTWESTTYTGSREMTLNFSNLGGYGNNYNFIVKK